MKPKPDLRFDVLHELETKVEALGWGGLLSWSDQPHANNHDQYQSGLFVTNPVIRFDLFHKASIWFLMGAVNQRTGQSTQIHTLNTFSSKRVINQLYGSRVPAHEPLEPQEMVDFLAGVKQFWVERLDNPDDGQVASCLILDELVTRWYRRDRTGHKFALDAALEMIHHGVSLKAILYYTELSYHKSLPQRKSGYYRNLKKKYITLETLTRLNVDRLPFEMVKTFINEGALPELA